jgi:acylpyruvate hydrolase
MKIFCIGRNYAEHAKELKNEVPTSPVIFMKPPTAILKDNRPFYFPEFSKEIHYETELVLKISKNGKFISEKFAERYYEEISLGIDFTARDIQNNLKAKGLPWELAKGFDNSAAIGKFIPLSELPNAENIKFELKLNDKTVQSGNSAQMIFNFNKLISFISQYFTLQKGDLIYTGTPAGVGEIKIGDNLSGILEGKELFAFNIK